MKSLLRGLCCIGLLVALTSFASAADKMWTGKISDSMCGASHAKMIAGHAGMTDKDCTLACIKAGAKYVFVSGKGLRHRQPGRCRPDDTCRGHRSAYRRNEREYDYGG